MLWVVVLRFVALGHAMDDILRLFIYEFMNGITGFPAIGRCELLVGIWGFPFGSVNLDF